MSLTNTIERNVAEPAINYLDEHGNRSIRVKDRKTVYRGYTIVEKQDFGQYGFNISGFSVRHGYVITDGLCNVMPGGTWALTVSDAMRMIDDYIESRNYERGNGEHPFWALNRFRRHTEERAPELALLLQAVLDDPAAMAAMNPTLAKQITAVLDRIDDICDRRSVVRDHTTGETRKIGERTTGRFSIPD